jgi:ABC-type methionine transport system ATPase subunit
MAPIIKVRNLHKRFKDPAHRGEWLHVIQGVDLDIEPGQVVVIIGRSGAGKSTLLRCLNFLEDPDDGTVEIDGWRSGPVSATVSAAGKSSRSA